MLNSVKARPKLSSLERVTGQMVIYTFILLIVFCVFAGLTYGIWEYRNQTTLDRYLMQREMSIWLVGLIRFGNWMLIFGNFVPISMMLTLETVKFFQGNLMAMDEGLTASNGIECKVQSSNLNEELGQVEYVFSDKTGTLTCNEMRFKYLIVGPTVYGEERGYSGQVPFVKNVDFQDGRVWDKIAQKFPSEEDKLLKKCLLLLGLCHNVVLEQNGDLNASSPDELAFVYFAKLVGNEFKGRDDDNNVLMDYFGQTKSYKLLDLFEFNSDRKRMSVIIQNSKGNITMYTKGADSIMIPRFSNKPYYDIVMKRLDSFASVGLRTLLLGSKDLTQEEYQQFKTEYEAAKNDLDNREARMDQVEDKWERGLTLIGATAIEDRLQNEVRKGSFLT
jgi:phospholipid-transporting ATPase